MGMLLTYRPGYWGDAPAEPDEANASANRPLSRQNLEQLQETARGLGVDPTGSKAELRERIREHQDGTPTAKPGDGQPSVDEDVTPDGEQPAPENDPADTEDGEGDESQPDPENDPEDAESDPAGE